MHYAYVRPSLNYTGDDDLHGLTPIDRINTPMWQEILRAFGTTDDLKQYRDFRVLECNSIDGEISSVLFVSIPTKHVSIRREVYDARKDAEIDDTILTKAGASVMMRSAPPGQGFPGW